MCDVYLWASLAVNRSTGHPRLLFPVTWILFHIPLYCFYCFTDDVGCSHRRVTMLADQRADQRILALSNKGPHLLLPILLLQTGLYTSITWPQLNCFWAGQNEVTIIRVVGAWRFYAALHSHNFPGWCQTGSLQVEEHRVWNIFEILLNIFLNLNPTRQNWKKSLSMVTMLRI